MMSILRSVGSSIRYVRFDTDAYDVRRRLTDGEIDGDGSNDVLDASDG